MVAEKLDPTVSQTCFHRIFQTVRNMRKKTTGMSSEGPKMGRGRYGSAWNDRKIGKSDDPSWRPSSSLPAPSGRVRQWLDGKFHRRGRLTLLLLPGRRVCKGGGGGGGGGGVVRIASHGHNPFGLKMVQNDPVRVHRFLGNFLGFWSSK